MDRRIHRFRSEKVEVTVLHYDDSDDHRGLPNELTHFGNLRWLLDGLDSSSTLLRFFVSSSCLRAVRQLRCMSLRLSYIHT